MSIRPRLGSQFTRFTGTQVQILTPALRCKDPPPDVLEIWDMVGDKLPGTPASFVSPYYPPGTVQAYVSMRQHTSACVSIRQHTGTPLATLGAQRACALPCT